MEELMVWLNAVHVCTYVAYCHANTPYSDVAKDG